jgi:hypothetical protein
MACNYLEFNISSIDLADATGNTNVPPYIDGVVYNEYNDCSGNTITLQYSSAGIFSATTCFDSLFFINQYYYKNDAATVVSVSTFINTGEPCTPLTSVWYQITNCADSSISYSQEYSFGTFAINDRVTSPGNVWVITGSVFVDPGGTLYAITSTGLTGCPSIPTPIWYQIQDCNDSSVGFSIAYTAGAFALNERCTAVNVSTRTVIIIGSTSTLPGGPLYTLTSLGTTGCISPTPNPTPNPTPDSTPASTPASTPGSTPNVTPTQTPSKTPTQTPTNTTTPTQTPSYTPTQTMTPSTSGIICGLGITTGTYYYTDCCGDLIQGNVQNLTVSMDYTKPSSGINKLNSVATQACLTPTPTQTQTYTPTNTITPSITASPTYTPTITPSTTVTPSKSAVYRLKNNCDVFTLFELGVSCNVIAYPSSSTSNDGILSLNVTGGTSPYSFYWTNGQRTQTLAQVGAGIYECTVIDYYGDYSSTTVCSLLVPTATPTPSVTTTPTVTPSGTCPKLCFIAIGTSTAYGPWQFTCNGMFNGKTTWNYTDYNIVWTGVRWEIVGSDMTTPFVAVNGGIFASNSTSSIPSNGWASVGGTYAFSVTMTEGNCPATIPIQTKVTFENSTCDGIKNCDGTITISASYGTPPYQYSINNGLTYQSNGLFFGLCPNTYTIITRDSLNNSVNNSVTVGYNQALTTYQLSVKQLANATVTVSGPNFNTTTTYLEIITNPPLPTGVTLEFDLNLTSIKTTNGPGFGTINDNISISQNGNLISPTTQQSPVTQINSRPNCSPETQEVKTETESYSCVLSKTSTVTFITQSALEITNGQISTNSCVTNLTQTIYAGISSQVIKGCTCCNVVADTNLLPTVSNDVSYQSNATPISTSYFTADIYDSNCLNIGSTIVGVNSSEVIVGYYYPVSGLSGPVIQITGLTNEFPTYFVTINSIGYSSCGEIQSQT